MSDPKTWFAAWLPARNSRRTTGGAVRRIRRRFKPWLAVLALFALLAAPSTVVQAQGPAQLTFSGGGWGHGVGMSQYGARNMGDQGFTHAEILAHYYEGTELAAVLAPENMRVHLADIGEVTFSSSGPLIFDIPGQPPQEVPAGNLIAVKAVDGGLQLGSLMWVPVTQDNPILVSYPSPVRVSATGHSYIWGKLQLTVAAGKVRVVETNLTMEQYVEGIAEMPASWPAEALAAQAIAARTYAHYMASDRRIDPEWTREFDIYGSTLDQNYEGYDAQHPNWLAAVSQTANKELTWQGNTVKAYYSATNGGATERAGNVFDLDLPYTTARQDVFDSPNPWTPWQRSFTIDELSRYFSRVQDTSVGLLQGLRISDQVAPSGRVDKTSVELTGTNGTKVITGRRMMVVINAGVFAEGGGLGRHLPSTLLALGTQAPAIGALPTSGAAPQPLVSDTGTEAATVDAPAPVETGPRQPVAEVGKMRAIADGQVLVEGWAFDPDAPLEPLAIEVYLNTFLVDELFADTERATVAERHPEAGPNHGFVSRVAPGSAGVHKLCLVARDHDGASGISLGCQWVVVQEINGEIGTTTLSASSSSD